MFIKAHPKAQAGKLGPPVKIPSPWMWEGQGGVAKQGAGVSEQ